MDRLHALGIELERRKEKLEGTLDEVNVNPVTHMFKQAELDVRLEEINWVLAVIRGLERNG